MRVPGPIVKTKRQCAECGWPIVGKGALCQACNEYALHGGRQPRAQKEAK